jgi:class 3 adenylate cyclase
MSSKWRRFEVLLPLQFNDGSDVPAELLAEAVLEIVDYFGAASYETQKVEGQWRHGGVLIRDNLVKLVVDAPDVVRNRRWMKQYKERWRSQLEQVELWMVSYSVDVE